MNNNNNNKSFNKDRISIINASAFSRAQRGTPLFQDRETEGQSDHYTLKTPRFFKADACVCGNSPGQVPSVSSLFYMRKISAMGLKRLITNLLAVTVFWV